MTAPPPGFAVGALILIGLLIAFPLYTLAVLALASYVVWRLDRG